MAQVEVPVIFRFPFGGDVPVHVAPVTNWFSPAGFGQYGLFNVNLGSSSAPALEAEMLQRVGSYGRQLGQLGEAVGALIAIVERNASKLEIHDDEREALKVAAEMVAMTARVKREFRNAGRGSARSIVPTTCG